MHQILRQVLEVDVRGDEHMGFEVQRQVTEVCRRAVSKHLELALDSFDADDKYYVIDKMEIDLGSVAIRDLEIALTRSLAAAVSTTMRERGLRERALIAKAAVGPGLSNEEADCESVLHFLQHGRLPWWYTARGHSLEEALTALLSPSPGPWLGDPGAPPREEAFVERLSQVLRSNARARERLRHQFSSACVLSVLMKLNRPQYECMLEATATAREASLGPSLLGRIEGCLIEAAVESLEKKYRRREYITAAELIQRSAELLVPRLSAKERAELSQALGVDVRPNTALSSSSQVPASDAAPAEDLVVEDAGVVLLHPFVPQFFESVGIAKDGALVNGARGALLLHHLATGALTAEEYELVLAKILCGIPVESSVPREPPVTADEQGEAIKLLESAVRHWPVLRGTTADGLRGNFLTRRGRVELGQSDWLLRVESRSYDMLLESLPWGVAHVKFQWMSRLMQIEWSA